MKNLKSVELYVDEDQYVCFADEIDGSRVFWTLHRGGWEAFLDDSVLLFGTDQATLPSDEDRVEAARAVAEMRTGQVPECPPR